MQTELTLPDEHVDLHISELRSTLARLTSCSKLSQTCNSINSELTFYSKCWQVFKDKSMKQLHKNKVIDCPTLLISF